MRRSSWLLSGIGVVLAVFAVLLVFQFGGGSTVDGSGTGEVPAGTVTATASADPGTGTQTPAPNDAKGDGATNDQTGKPGENK
jgi:hypothetical protein